MNNLPVYNFPATIFSEKNTIREQIDHVLSESREVDQTLDDPCFDETDTFGELADLTQSLESLWRRVEQLRGQEFVQMIFAQMEEKNRVRGYYL